MKLGILSDSHDRLPALRNAIALLHTHRVDAFIHAGDYVAPFAAKLLTPEHLHHKPLHCIYGNNDGERAGLLAVLPQLTDGPLRLTLNNTRIAVAHYEDWFKPADSAWADVLISGHNHAASIKTHGDRLLLNPGESCGWLTGRCTVATLDLATMKAELLDVPPG